jgi:hypothetical protein
MSGAQTAGFDLVMQFSEDAYQELLGVFFDTSGLIPRLVALIPGLDAEDFTLSVSLDRPTDVALTPPDAESPLDIRLVLGQGAGAATLRVVVGMVVDRSAADRDTVVIDFRHAIYFAEVRVAGHHLPIPNLVAKLAGILPAVPVLPVPVDRAATAPTAVTRADFRIIDDVSPADRDATAGMLTFGGGVAGDAAALQSFVPDGGRGAIGIFFNWLARMAAPAMEHALGLPAGSFTIGPDSMSLNRTVRVDEDEEVDLTALTMRLDQGFIAVSARVSKSGFCYDASGEVSARIHLAIQGGRLQASVEIGDPDVDVDIPWYCWLAAGVIGAVIGGVLLGVIGAIVGGVLVPLILWISVDVVEGTIEKVADRIVEAINQAIPDVDVPAFGVDILFQEVFIDDVVIAAALAVRDKAPIRCQGTVRLQPGQSLDLDDGKVDEAAAAPGDLRWTGLSWGRRLETGCQAGLARTGRTDLDGVQRFQLYGLPYQTRAGVGFQELGAFDPLGVFTGDFVDETRAVLAVRTNEGRYAVVQATRLDLSSWVDLRYRTYERKVPTVAIVGEFQCALPGEVSAEATAVFEPSAPVDGQPAIRAVTAVKPAGRVREATAAPELTRGTRVFPVAPVYAGRWVTTVFGPPRAEARLQAVTASLGGQKEFRWSVGGQGLDDDSHGTLQVYGVEVRYTVKGPSLLLSVAADAAVELFVQVTAVDRHGCEAEAGRCVRRGGRCPTRVRQVPAWPQFRALQQLPVATLASGLVTAHGGILQLPGSEVGAGKDCGCGSSS